MENRKLVGIVAVIVVIAIAGIVAFLSPTATGNHVLPIGEKTIKIGFVGPLTGEVANWGQNGLAGVSLAVSEINAQGGINGKQIELIIEDDKATPADAVNAFTKLVNVDGVKAIFSSSGSAATEAGLPIAQKNNVPVVIVTATAPHLAQTGDFIFRITPSDSLQGKFVADFLYNELNLQKVALVFEKSAWGEDLAQVFKNHFSELGGTINYESGVLPSETDFKTEIMKMQGADIQGVYFPVYPEASLIAFRQMSELGFSIPLVGGDIYSGQDEIQNSSFTNGIMFSVSKVNLPEDFEARIHALPSFENLDVFYPASLGFDATQVFFSALKQAGTNPQALKNALAQTSYSGVSSPLIEFDEYGDLKDSQFEIKIIQDNSEQDYS